jgi:stage V sporulation protein D (sporulation-specific penicillin-binding protein)
MVNQSCQAAKDQNGFIPPLVSGLKHPEGYKPDEIDANSQKPISLLHPDARKTVGGISGGKMAYCNEVIVKKRIAWLLIAVLVLTGCLILRVIYLQVFLSGWLREKAETQRFRALAILPRRGAIYDRNGNALAISIDAECVYAIPEEVGLERVVVKANGRSETRISKTAQDQRKIARMIGGVLAVDPEWMERLLAKQASFVWIKRKASFEEIEKLRRTLKKAKIHGIEISQSPQRFYPQKQLAAQVLGIAGIDNQGLEGLEKYLDRHLQGVPGSDRAEFDTLGRHIPQGERRYLPPVDGDVVFLTIDQNIQYITERELEKAVIDTKSKRGMAITVNPQTGEILSLANYPKYDPNNFKNYPAANRRNALFSDMYEPGSTFKVFTAAAALEEGLVTPESTFFCPGYIIVDDRRLKCHKVDGHGNENFVEALENSCNPVFATLALRLSKETFYRYIEGFGFGKTTGVDFPGETPGWLKPLAKVGNVELANIGFGQGITVTPIQMAMGVAAIANGGYLLKPLLIKEIRSTDDKLIKSYHTQVTRQVLSAQTSALMRQLLESVVNNGTGNRAYLPGYRIAGKTGTAQKVVPGRRGYSQLIASFIAFAPADNPRLAALVVLDEPGSVIKYGGVIAAPVVGNIFRDALRYLGVKPQYGPDVLAKMAAETVEVPRVLNLKVSEGIKLLKKAQMVYQLIGSGEVIYDQVPTAGAIVDRGTKVILYLDPKSQFIANTTKVVTPELKGLTNAKARQILAELGLKLQTEGEGIISSQTPAPGTIVDYGSAIRANVK